MKKKELTLDFIWKIRLKLRADGNKLWADGAKLKADGNKLWADGNKLWADAVLEVYGNIKIEWKNWSRKRQDYECHLETGEIFKP